MGLIILYYLGLTFLLILICAVLAAIKALLTFFETKSILKRKCERMELETGKIIKYGVISDFITLGCAMVFYVVTGILLFDSPWISWQTASIVYDLYYMPAGAAALALVVLNFLISTAMYYRFLLRKAEPKRTKRIGNAMLFAACTAPCYILFYAFEWLL